MASVSRNLLHQEECVLNMLEDFKEKHGVKNITNRMTVGQSGAAPDSTRLEQSPGGKPVRSTLGQSPYAVRGTRLDATFGNNRLLRFTDK